MRNFIASIGDQFKVAPMVSAMSLIISALAFLRANDVLEIDINNPSAVLEIVLLVLGFTLIMMIAANGIGSLLIWISEKIPANVEIVAPQPLDTDIPETNVKSKAITFRNYGTIRILNKESSELTHCYAVLKRVRRGPLNDVTGIFGVVGKRLRWKDNLGNDNCEISIGARTGEAVLRVYTLAIDLSKDSIVQSDFDTCKHTSMRVNRPMGIYEIEIELYGKINGKDVKISPFSGIVEIAVSNSEDGMRFGIEVRRDKNPKRRPKKGNGK